MYFIENRHGILINVFMIKKITPSDKHPNGTHVAEMFDGSLNEINDADYKNLAENEHLDSIGKMLGYWFRNDSAPKLTRRR
jgi:predicted nuclease of restriction endonuclease-like RecB superfamily